MWINHFSIPSYDKHAACSVLWLHWSQWINKLNDKTVCILKESCSTYTISKEALSHLNRKNAVLRWMKMLALLCGHEVSVQGRGLLSSQFPFSSSFYLYGTENLLTKPSNIWMLDRFACVLPSGFFFFNPYKPSVLFVGHRQTVQNQIRCRKTRRLIRLPLFAYRSFF